MKINTSLLLILMMVGLSAQLHCTKSESPASNDTDSSKKIIDNLNLFIGTYTYGSGSSKSNGIYWYSINLKTLSYSLISVTNASNPSYLCIHRNKLNLYCVNENSPGSVSAFYIDTINKKLTLLNSVSSKGNSPCYISVARDANYALVANYGSGNYSIFKILEQGKLSNALDVLQDYGKGPNASRQEGPHAHMIDQNPHNLLFYATDLGIDAVNILTIDSANNKLIRSANAAQSASGSGPRHFAIHPFKNWFYLLNELNGTIEVSNIQPDGSLMRFQTISTMPENDIRYPGSADIHITPNGRFLYATNRGNVNNIAAFSIDENTGELRLIDFYPCGGKTPRNFIIDPSGKYLLVANQDSNNIVIFQISEKGQLINTGISITVPMPVCLKFLEL